MNIPENRLGMGCWAIGGPFFTPEGAPVGYANTDDACSKAAIETAYDGGVRVFDTADVYGAGHSERLVGEVLAGRDDVTIITKLGFAFDEDTKVMTGERHDAAYVRAALEASRKRLGRDVLDMVFLHLNSLPVDDANQVFDTLAEAREQGIVGAFGWSTDYPDSARAMAGREGFVAIQHCMNVFFDAPTLSGIIAEQGWASFNRSPLAMGLLTGKFVAGQALPEEDVRATTMDWMDYFKDGKVSADFIARLDAVRELLTFSGRTLAQGALGWLWAKSPHTVPIPGARTAQQAEHNASAISFGPLPQGVMDEIEAILQRPPEGPARDR